MGGWYIYFFKTKFKKWKLARSQNHHTTPLTNKEAWLFIDKQGTTWIFRIALVSSTMSLETILLPLISSLFAFGFY